MNVKIILPVAMAAMLVAGTMPTPAFALDGSLASSTTEERTAEAQAMDATERISPNEDVVAMLPQNATHTYVVVLDRPGVVSVTYGNAMDAAGSWRFSFGNADDTFYESWLYTVGGDGQEGTTYDMGLPAGTYYVKVWSASSYVDAPYKVRVNYEARSDWETEPNQTEATSDPVELGRTYYGNTPSTSDKDTFSFSLDEPSVVNVSFGCPASARIQSWDYTIANKDGSFSETWYRYSTDVGDVVSPSIGLPAGEYTLEVAGGFGATSNYHFRIDARQDSHWETENNGGFPVADPITPGITYTGTSHEDYDRDCYRFELDAPSRVRIACDADYLQGNHYWPIRLYDSSEKQLKYWSYSADTGYEDFTEWVDLPAGVYYVSFGGSMTREEYRFRVEAATNYGFSDVDPGSWFATPAVLGYAVGHGLMSGYGDTGLFGPEDPITRGQVATVLWRVAGKPHADAQDFQDVDYGQYYGDAIEWARSTGVVKGDPGNTFRPEAPVTREELCVMLVNYAANIAHIPTATDCTALDAISGASGVSPWARDAMGWAVDEGIISGEAGDGVPRVNPQGETQRCAAAKMFSVFHRDVLRLG